MKDEVLTMFINTKQLFFDIVICLFCLFCGPCSNENYFPGITVGCNYILKLPNRGCKFLHDSFFEFLGSINEIILCQFF